MNISWIIKGTDGLEVGNSYFQAESLDELNKLVKENDLSKSVVYDGSMEGKLWYPSEATNTIEEFESLIEASTSYSNIILDYCNTVGTSSTGSLIYAQVSSFKSIGGLLQKQFELDITLVSLKALIRNVRPMMLELNDMVNKISISEKETTNEKKTK